MNVVILYSAAQRRYQPRPKAVGCMPGLCGAIDTIDTI